MARKYKATSFLAVDGESVTDELGHRYVLICASTGEDITNVDGLSTEECFEFLLDLKRKYPDHTLVGFGFNYDVNMMLRDIPRVQLQQLWNDRSCTLFTDSHMYDVTWIPTKFLRILSDVTVDVSDVFGFFQMSFLKALQDWKVTDIDGAIERIESGKADRGNFSLDELPDITRYCHDECTMLVDLCERLQDALVDAGLYIKSWIGAGAVGQAMLKQNKVLDHHVHDYTYPPELQNAIMYGYFGGRFEMYRQGYFETCYNYDIVSAYPYECLNLPSLIGSWEPTKQYDPDAKYAIWKVEWDCDTKLLVMPFPYRHRDGNIYYPSSGAGWYWQSEVREALKLHPNMKVTKGFVYYPLDEQARPFEFLTEVWEKRKAAKAAGHASQKAYKLGMNSLYGKLAQGRGFEGRIPQQRSFVWAGMICSGTRARLLTMLDGQQDSVIAVATDGIFFKDDPGYQTGTELGELELNTVEDFYQLLNGVYYSPNAKIRTRGHSPNEIDWTDLCRQWDTQKMDGTYRYHTHRFIGLGQALLRKDFSLWRTWVDYDREVNLHQWFRKYLEDNELEQFETDTLTQEFYTWFSGELDGIKLGKQYKPKTDITSIQTEADREAVLSYLEMMEQPTLFIS